MFLAAGGWGFLHNWTKNNAAIANDAEGEEPDVCSTKKGREIELSKEKIQRWEREGQGEIKSDSPQPT